MTGALLAVDPRGRGNLSLREKWRDGPRTYLGLTMADFPNLFTITGPGSPSVLSNMMVSIEQHVDLAAACIEFTTANGFGSVEPEAEAERAWTDRVREIGDETLYPRAGSWYMASNSEGIPRVLLPYVGGVGEYRRLCDEIVAEGFRGFAFQPRSLPDEVVGAGPVRP